MFWKRLAAGLQAATSGLALALSTSTMAHIRKQDVQTVTTAAIGLDTLKLDDFKILREAIGSARVVCIGEETHGTEDFYRLRADITRALIKHEGFTSVLCEADFPPFWELNRFVGGTHKVRDIKPPRVQPPLDNMDAVGPSKPFGHPISDAMQVDIEVHEVKKGPSGKAKTIDEAMAGLKERFPVWMWHNKALRDFALWLKDHNEGLTRSYGLGLETAPLPVSLLGLDIYSLFTSADEVIAYLNDVDPPAAKQARRRYGLLGSFRPEVSEYVHAVKAGFIKSQAERVRAVVRDLAQREGEYSAATGDGDEYFGAAQNARIVAEAEQYYRSSFMGGTVTWNMRDKAMVDMIHRELDFQDKKRGKPGSARAVVWAHNSHLGDANATEHAAHRQHNVGGLVRSLFGKEGTFLLGLCTHHGTVRAARRWSGRDTSMELNPSLPNSSGDLLHKVAEARSAGGHDFGLIFCSNAPAAQLSAAAAGDSAAAARAMAAHNAANVLRVERLQRFVGVSYVKATERYSHYCDCCMSDQYDAVIHIDETSALEPLAKKAVPAEALRPGSVDYTKWQALARDLPEEELSEEEW